MPVNMEPSSNSSRPKAARLVHRLWAHHLPLASVSALAVWLLYVTRPYRDTITRLSFATAYPALLLLALTLAIGPWNILRGQRMPVSSDWRRDAGIWAGILSLVHTAVGQNVHLRGRPWLYYVYAKREHHSFPVRHDWFGLANYTGAIGALLVLMLLATSSDYALRALGTPGWKQLQRWNYAAFALVGVHTLAYQRGVENQKLPFVVPAVVSLLIASLMQAAGFVLRRRNAAAAKAAAA